MNKDVFLKIRKWNAPPFNVSRRFDKKVVTALLVACVSYRKLASNKIDEGVLEFIQCK